MSEAPALPPFAEFLRRSRLAAGLTQEELAERTGLSPRGLVYLERGTRQPYRDTVRRLAEALGLAGEARVRFEAAGNKLLEQAAQMEARQASPSAESTAEDMGAPSRGVANPFFHRGPVRDRSYFYGRAAETRYLADLLRQGQCVAVHGQRRLGKTSLLFHIADPAVAAAHGLDPETTRWVYLDGGSLDGLDEEWLYGSIDRALGGEEDAVPYQRFVARLRALAAEGMRLIVALDEFEVVAANSEFGPTLFNRLRGLVGRFPLQIVTASRDQLLDLTVGHPETLSSPFFNIFAPLHVTLLAEDDARALLMDLSARGGRRFGPATCDWLLELAGPHPLFLQMAGYRAFDALETGATAAELADSARDTVQETILADLDQHLRYYWRSLHTEERYTLAALPLLDHEAGSPAIARLASAGLVRGRGYLGDALERFIRRQAVDGLLQAEPLLMDVRRGLVAVRGVAAHLTPTEFAALRLLLERCGQLVTPEEIEAVLWPGEFVADPERARGVVKKLRGALGEAGGVIVNRRGQGYTLSAE